MPARPGERARRTATFYCQSCGHPVQVHKGERMPDCPCGASEYDERAGEPGDVSS